MLNDNVRRFDRLVGEERGGCCAFTNALQRLLDLLLIFLVGYLL